MTRGQIIPKDKAIPHKKFLVRVYVGRDDTGKRKYHSETVTGTISEARKKRDQMLGGIAQGSFVAPSRVTLKDYLTDYLSTKRDIEAAVLDDYKHWMNTQVIPVLGNVKLGKLTKDHFKKLYVSLSSERSYSKRTVTYIHAILHLALDVAVQDGKLGKNPCEGAQVAIPKVDPNKKLPIALTFEQTQSIIEKTTGDRWYALWRLLLTTGLRPQEALALKWSDIKPRCVTVNRALVRLHRTKNQYDAREFHTKRPASRRQVDISEETSAALEGHRKVQLKECLESGVRTEFVFATARGNFMIPKHCNLYWKRMVKQLGLPQCSVYTARHTHLTHLLSSGVNAKAVAARAGQSNPMVLLSTYAHVLPEIATDAANILERRLSDARRPDMGSAQVGPQKGVRGVGSA
jgi:integrase